VPPGTVLKPAPPAKTAPTSVVSTQWQSYLYQAANPAPGITGQTPQPQATTESGTGTFADNGDGTYQYTFTKDLSADPAVSYDATLVHRVAFEIRGLASANSPVYTFQPSTGATTNLPLSREIVDDQTCKNCHMLLGLPTEVGYHGGARTEIQYCVMCHNPSSVDPSTGNTLDFKVMFHKIHMGVNLPSVVAGGSYNIYGFMNSVNDYSAIVFPTNDLRTCHICHNESDKTIPDTVNWRTVPSVESCGSCHDNVNFATGANHSTNIVAGNTQCSTCHGTTSNIDNGALQVAAVHMIPERQYQKSFTYNIVKITGTRPGQTPVLQFSVTNPTNSNKPWSRCRMSGKRISRRITR
jgi:OmcA/MtrC family decaheme c-type cytochrome